MKNFICFFLTITLTIFLGSCTAQVGEPPSTETLRDDQLALDILIDFLQSLHDGQYDQAAQLYGGTYEAMIDLKVVKVDEDKFTVMDMPPYMP